MNPYKLFTLTFLLVLSSLSVVGQFSPDKTALIDSLKKVVEQAAHDTTRVDAYIAWGKIIRGNNPELSDEIVHKVNEICEDNLAGELTEKEKYTFLFYKTWVLNSFGSIEGK